MRTCRPVIVGRRSKLALLCFGVFCGVALSFAVESRWNVPTSMKELSNGLKVVVSEDHSAPTFGICVSYGIGFRLEPEGRTGFAHLFEHMMFEGTPRAPKGTLDRVIESGGGTNNGDTRYDFTEYIETAPIAALEPLLWLEADRMKTLDFSPENLENQRKVVEEEVRVNVLNRPYGLFFAIDLPGKAFDTYPNAHNFYGDFRDLDAANIDDVEKFFQAYYTPNNAVLAIVGDVRPDDVFAKVEKYFSGVPRGPAPPAVKVDEPPQTAERHAVQEDKLARVPAVAIGYRMPAHGSREAVVAAVAGELLHNGQASLLYQRLVKQKQVAISVDGGLNWPLGNPLEYKGPTLMTSFIVAPANTKEETIVSAYDEVISELMRKGPSEAELARVTAKMRSDWYGQLEVPISRASILSHAVLFDGNAQSVNALPAELASVTPAEIRTVADKYLVNTNRTIIYRKPTTRKREDPK
ncbi:MAG: insulinase family protein [Acidobacteriaceae bacterium]|nr:insulinase family protein [Acidobacteriaceae bacterium]